MTDHTTRGLIRRLADELPADHHLVTEARAVLAQPPPPAEGVAAELVAENRKLRSAGCKLAEAAIRVAQEYDGVHRLMLTVSEWAKTVADEGGRGKAVAHALPLPEVTP